MAFPNAYVSTDEPPGRSWTRSALCILAIVGVGYFGAIILALSFATGLYNPVTQFASDYGVGVYGPEMNSGFILAGIGVVSLSAAVLSSEMQRVQKAGGALLLFAGLALLASGCFQTDLEGAAPTLHGAVHNTAGVIFFLTSPVGLALITWGFGLRRFVVTLGAFILGGALAVANSSLNLNATGLSERVVILFVFSSLIFTAVSAFRQA